MAVAEIFLAAFLQVLFDKLLSLELLNFARQYEGLEEKLDQWTETLRRIEAVLDDAEKQHTERAVIKQWLDDLRDLAYDVEDILDEFATEALLRKLKGGDQASTSKVRKFIPSCFTGFTPSALKISIRLGSKIDAITDRFNKIVKRKDDLNLRETAAYERSNRKRGTPASTTLVNEARVYGREKDKEAMLQMLLSEKRSDAEVSVIPIIGMGGIGKTTLAKLLYNDEKLQKNFNMKAWACVSEDYDDVRVTKTVLKSVTSESCDDNDLNLLQVKLKKELTGKKFLVVLDDLWNENYNDWTTLRAPFEAGAPGSVIVITTRNQGVASMAGSIPKYSLQVLTNDACLSIFTQHALGASNFNMHPTLQDIGEKIVEKCKGLPLAAKTLGGLLRNTLDHDDWEDVLKSKMWDIPEERSGIVPALMLSYHHLPSHLKRCFAYCSILPKDYEFKEQLLVLLWMAEGLIQPEGGKQMEDLGSQYFHNLLSRSFFQQSSSDGSLFVIHDLIIDLAQLIAGDTCFRMEHRIETINKGKISKKVRHLSYLGDYFDGPKKFEDFSELTCLRTFMPLPHEGHCFLTHDVPLKLLPKLLCLRVLSLSGYCIVELADSIGDLKHLRYLDLSYTNIRVLPESTTMLCNLQTLILENCSYLKKLPSKLGNLVNLRHLNILKADKLEGMPPQIGNLTCLQTLSNLIVQKSNCCALKELGYLLHLRGTLIISHLENVTESMDAGDAKLIEKPNLSALCLEWSVNVDESKDRTSELGVLNMLLPHKNLKELIIRHYGGIEFSTWLKVPSFPSMVLLRIENCRGCTSLPAVGQLPLLKDLFIKGMATVKNVGHEFYGEGCSQTFRSLETLCFRDMEEWENWSPNGEFPHLRELSIINCPKLLGMLPNHLPSLQNVVIERCEQLMVSISSFPELCKLEIHGSKGVVRESKVDFNSLNFYSLSTISEFRFPVEGFMNVEFLCIQGCEELSPLWSNDVGLLQSLPRLRQMEVYKYMSSTRNGMESLLKAVVYNSTCLESIFIWGCDSLTHIAVGQLPPTLKKLTVQSCENMQILLDGDDTINCSGSDSLLEKLLIHSCPSLKSLTSSGELPATLRSLDMQHCKMLESVAKSVPANSSLETIRIVLCENLKSLPMGIHNLSHLHDISIYGCSSLVSFPGGGLLPRNLRQLYIYNCEKMQALPNCIHNITSLQELRIYKCPGIVSFPKEGFPTNLTSLKIRDCNIIESLLEWGLHKLTSLQLLDIEGGCPHLVSFPEMMLPASLTSLYIRNFQNLKYLSSKGFRNLSSLKTLRIGWCEKLMSFPDDGLPPSLLDLRIVCCEKLTSFTEDVLPPSLQQLHIANCPLLIERCKKDQGRAWIKIAQIPCVKIDGMFIYDPEPEEQDLPADPYDVFYS